MDGSKTDTIPTNLRLLAVLEQVAQAGTPVTPTAVNDILGLPKPTIHRLFATLEEEGFLQRDLDGRSYGPGRRLRIMASGILSSHRVRAARQAILKRLSTQIGETCNLAIPDVDAMAYIERVETEWPLRIQLAIGARVPLYCTASGKMYLSSLTASQLQRYLQSVTRDAHTANTITDADALMREVKQVQAQGYALDQEEFMDDMIALAVPVRDPFERMFATLSFHAPTQRFNIAKALDYLDPLKAAAQELTDLLQE